MNFLLLLASEGAENQSIPPNWTALAAQVVIFLALLGILYKFFWGRIYTHLAQRETSIKETFEKIERDKAEIERLTKEYGEKLAGIEKEAHAKMQEAVKEGAGLRARMVSDAQAEASAALEKAKREIVIEKEKAIEQLRVEVIRLTLAAAERVIEQTMTPEVHGKIVDRYLKEIENIGGERKP